MHSSTQSCQRVTPQLVPTFCVQRIVGAYSRTESMGFVDIFGGCTPAGSTRAVGRISWPRAEDGRRSTAILHSEWSLRYSGCGPRSLRRARLVSATWAYATVVTSVRPDITHGSPPKPDLSASAWQMTFLLSRHLVRGARSPAAIRSRMRSRPDGIGR